MYKYILILLFLFFPIISQTTPTTYAPMSVRTFDLDVEDICSYQKSTNDFKYVEPCEKDYKCEEDAFTGLVSGTIGICRKNNQVQTPFGSACEEDTDCNSDYTDLICQNKICVIDENKEAIHIDNTYFCPNNKLFPLSDENDNYICTKIEGNEETKKLCKSKTGSTLEYKAYPDYMKVCGEIELDADNNDYKKTSINSIGSVSDGKFVENLLACKSGFALNFYSDGETTSSTSTGIYQKCVQYNGIEYKKGGTCKIKYILDKKNYYYDVDKVDAALIDGSGNKQTFCNSFKFINAKLDLFNQYVNKVTQLGNECSNIKYYDEPFTCKNDELRKLYYFYKNIEKYLLYKNEDEITEFILQQVYPSYGVKYSKDDASKYLSNKFICLLILLLL